MNPQDGQPVMDGQSAEGEAQPMPEGEAQPEGSAE